MLSVRKVKLHGMKDNRWTTRDKITQYKGLINLFTRDRKIVQADSNIYRKKQKQQLQLLQQNILQDRETLTNASRGDRQQIRNVLQEHKTLQLAYQELQVMEIIEDIHQENFNKRKELDKLYNKMRNRTNRLICLKLRLAEVEDRIKYEPPGSSRLEIKAKIVTAKVQDAILKQDAAISVRHIYKGIVNIMKKDAIYFDAVLKALQIDANLQGKCMHTTIEMGQLATEYLDDRKNEYKTLEAIVQEDMSKRTEEVKKMFDEVSRCSKHLKCFMRKDNDLTLPLINVNTNIGIQEEIEHISKMLETLKDAFFTVDYNTLNSCIQEQYRQTQRLMDLQKKSLASRDTLQNKINHASCMYDNLYFAMVETTFEYVTTKKLFKQQIQEQINKRNACEQKLGNILGNLMVNIKSSLQHLEQFCKAVRDPNQGRKLNVRDQSSLEDQEIIDIHANALEIINALTPKLTLLAANTVPITDELHRELARIKLQNLVTMRTKTVITVLEDVITPSIMGEEIILEDSSVPNRVEIKAKSQLILDINRAMNEEFEPKKFGRRGKRKYFK